LRQNHILHEDHLGGDISSAEFTAAHNASTISCVCFPPTISFPAKTWRVLSCSTMTPLSWSTEALNSWQTSDMSTTRSVGRGHRKSATSFHFACRISYVAYFRADVCNVLRSVRAHGQCVCLCLDMKNFEEGMSPPQSGWGRGRAWTVILAKPSRKPSRIEFLSSSARLWASFVLPAMAPSLSSTSLLISSARSDPPTSRTRMMR